MHAATLLRATRKKRAKKRLHVGIAPPVHQQTKTVTATDQCQRRFRRAEKHDAGDLRSRGSQSTRMGFRLRARIGGDDDRSEAAEGRQNGLSRSTISLS